MMASGFLLYDKPAGPTSFKALGAFRNAFPGSKVGHTGTLDSFATGLLVLMAGSYSRLAPFFVGLDKRYRAEISFGSETDTLDPSGDVIAEGPLPARASLEAVLPKFTGLIQQIPPKYSAIHVGGARASDLALKGHEFELKPRSVTIWSLDLESYEEGKAVVFVHCSSGTYIRSLARDIAKSLGTFAHLSALRRLSVGPFGILEAETEISSTTRLLSLDPETVSSIGLGIGFLPKGLESDFSNGKPSALSALVRDKPGQGEDWAVFSATGRLLGIASATNLAAGSGADMPTDRSLCYRLVLAEAGDQS